MTDQDQPPSSPSSPTEKIRARLKLLRADPRAKLWPAAAAWLLELDQVLELLGGLESRLAAVERMLAAKQRLEGLDCDS